MASISRICLREVEGGEKRGDLKLVTDNKDEIISMEERDFGRGDEKHGTQLLFEID